MFSISYSLLNIFHVMEEHFLGQSFLAKKIDKQNECSQEGVSGRMDGSVNS